MTRNWSAPTSWDEACRRASGRRWYNSVRQFRAAQRQAEVARRLRELALRRGAQARLARELGVSAATINRDVQVLLRLNRCCPTCHRLGPLEE